MNSVVKSSKRSDFATPLRPGAPLATAVQSHIARSELPTKLSHACLIDDHGALVSCGRRSPWTGSNFIGEANQPPLPNSPSGVRSSSNPAVLPETNVPIYVSLTLCVVVAFDDRFHQLLGSLSSHLEIP